MSEQSSISSESAMPWLSGKEWLENVLLPEGTVFAELRWHGESEIVYSEEFETCTVQQAAELAVAHLIERSGIPDRVPMATVYWANGFVFGPFPVEISLSIEASCLRG